MFASHRRFWLLVLALVGGFVAVGVARYRGEPPLAPEAAVAPPPPPAVPPATADLQGAPPRRTTPRRRSGANSTHSNGTGPDDAGRTVTRRIHVRLPDGSDAREGTVVYRAPESDASPSGSTNGVMTTASIGSGGVAELRFAASEVAGASSLSVSVPGRPSVRVGYYPGGLPDETTEVWIPEGEPLSGTVVDSAGRGLADLPILVTSGSSQRLVVLDADLDFARRSERSTQPDYVHIETRTDAAGRFTVLAPTHVRGRPRAFRVLSRAPRWFVSPRDALQITHSTGGRDVGEIHAVPGIVLDVHVSARGVTFLADWVRLHVSSRIERPDSDENTAIEQGTEVHLPRPVDHVRMARTGPGTAEELTVVVELARPDPTHTPGVALVRFPVDVEEARADFALDRLDDDTRTGLVEVVVPGANATAGANAGLLVEVATADDPPVHVESRQNLRWIGPDRLDCRLAVGRWRVTLRESGNVRSWPLEARVDVIAGVTTRVTMSRPDGAPK